MRSRAVAVLMGLFMSIAAAGFLGLAHAGQSNDELPPTAVQEFYVAVEAYGSGDGSSRENAAYFRASAFWATVQRSLSTGPVTVYFAPGEYVFSTTPKGTQSRDTLRLVGMGHPEHRLVLQGLNPEGTVFMSDPTEPISESRTINLLHFDGQNATFRYFHFTGRQHIHYAARFFGENLLIEHNTFIDLPNVRYGATGTAYERSRYITYRDNEFKRVGSSSGAHMIYNAYGSQHINVINNYFEDSAGEYIRFRDEIDYVVVFGNTFRSTGSPNRTFVSFPLFNSRGPTDADPSTEYFGNHIIVAHNTFIYPDGFFVFGQRQAAHFLHRGYDPPGRGLLLSTADRNLLRDGTVGEKRAFMTERLGIDAEHVYFFNNTYQGRGSLSFNYDSRAQYGARSRGFNGSVDITDAMNPTPVVSTAEEAEVFWRDWQ